MQLTLKGKTVPPARPLKRVAVVLLLLFGSLATYGQPIRLSFQQAPLEDVFRQIEAKTPYRFIYTREELKQTQPVTLTITTRRIEKVLERIFAGQPLSYSIHKTYISVHRKGGPGRRRLPCRPASTCRAACWGKAASRWPAPR